MNRFKMLYTTGLVVAAVLGVALADSGIPTCTYPDPVQGTCTMYPTGGGTGTTVTITCRMIGSVPGSSGILEGTCSYYWCDHSQPCTSLPYTQWIRTKNYIFNDNNGGDCSKFFAVTSVHDTQSGCCNCTMAAVPGWPTPPP
ncbi:MAG TPA: hypothetical protein VMI31_11640 [Fimbriimonadaceae bacterium]|nr:hypothetical protein [Fimbriimonadaceae bacterium]